jgi:hypothetical protein
MHCAYCTLHFEMFHNDNALLRFTHIDTTSQLFYKNYFPLNKMTFSQMSGKTPEQGQAAARAPSCAVPGAKRGLYVVSEACVCICSIETTVCVYNANVCALFTARNSRLYIGFR